jgi:hypothetical protein
VNAASGLGRCLREQRDARRRLDSLISQGLPQGHPDYEGTWMGLCDWLMEEAIIRMETGRMKIVRRERLDVMTPDKVQPRICAWCQRMFYPPFQLRRRGRFCTVRVYPRRTCSSRCAHRLQGLNHSLNLMRRWRPEL